LARAGFWVRPGWRVRWPGGERTWITAVDYDTGRPAVFGRAGTPRVTFPDAVVASCSVPGWYRPLRIGRHRYVDGGVRSGTNADLLAGAGLTHVFVLAPAASLTTDSPGGMLARAERFVRRRMTGVLLRELERLRAAGTQVSVLTPGPEDLAVMGGNLMDGRRRLAVLETSLRTSAASLESHRAVLPASVVSRTPIHGQCQAGPARP
jgi:NTE family protein